jgi:hypothetical protein
VRRQRPFGRRLGDRPLDQLGGGVEPELGLGVLAAAEGEDVGDVLGVVDGDDAVGQHQRRVGQVGAVDVGRAAVGLQLVAEVADVAADQPALDALRRLDRDPLQLALQVVEDRLLLDRLDPAAADRDLAAVDVVFDGAAVRAGGGPHV